MKPEESRITDHESRTTFYVLRFTLLAILLLAAFLRFYRLDAQSFWNDEGNSARIAERTPDLILEGAEGDIHPPGYYLLLHYWRALFGQSEFALRAFSVAAGLALVLFTYVLGRRLFDETTGLVAAFLGAISPFAIYYSQEARMYALLAALSAASTYLLLRFLTNSKHQIPDTQSPISNLQSPPSNLQSPIFNSHPPISKPILLDTLTLYTLTSAAGLYTQYAFPFVLLVHNGIFGLWWLFRARRSTDRWRRLAVWVRTQAAVAVLYLPWLPMALQSVTGWSSAGRAYELGPALLDVLRVLGVGITLPVGQARAALVGAGLLLIVGLWPRRNDRTGWSGVASLALYLLLPIILIFAFDLYKPTWLKFLVVILPPFHLLLAHGIENLANVTQHAIRNTQYAVRIPYSVFRIVLVALLAILTLPSLVNFYFDPAYARDDYRQIAADIAAIAGPGDAVILNAPNQWEVFTYYYPDQDVYPAPYRPAPGEVDAFLSPLVERYRRFFVLYWGDAEADPQRLVETRLASQTYKTSDRWYGRVRLAVYGAAQLPEEPQVALDACFGASIHLRGYGLTDAWFAPGDILPVTLFWEAEAPITERYKVTVQLLDGEGQLIAQHDGEPGDGLIPTVIWEPGRSLADRHGIPLPHDLPAGRYRLIVGVYHVTTGERLPVFGGDHVALCDVVVRSSASPLPPYLPNAIYQRHYTVLQPTAASLPAESCCENWSGLYHNVREFYRDGSAQWVLAEAGLLRFDLAGKLLAPYVRPGHASLDWGMYVMAPDGDGGVWVGSDDGVWSLRDGQWTHLLVTDQPISDVAVDENGELWASIYDYKWTYQNRSGDRGARPGRPPGHAGPMPPVHVILYHYAGDGAWESWRGSTGNTNVPAPVLMRDHCDLWDWISPSSSCEERPHPAPPLADIQRWLEESDLLLLPPATLQRIHSAVTVDPQGAVWASRHGSDRLLVFERGHWSEVEIERKSQEAPRGFGFNTLCLDSAGNAWIGSGNGVCRLDGPVASAELGAVAGLVEDWNGRIWVGLVHRGVARLDGDIWTRFDADSGALPSDLVTSLAVDTVRQRLYVGTHGGLAAFDGQDWIDLGNPLAGEPMWINALALGSDDGSVWVGYYSGPTREGQFAGDLLWYGSGRWERVPLPVQAAVGALLVDGAGRLWAGLIPVGFSGHGSFDPRAGPSDTPPIWSYANGEWRPVGAAQGLDIPAIFSLAEARDRIIWAAGAIGISTIDPATIWREP
jgi:mannosyltransferase